MTNESSMLIQEAKRLQRLQSKRLKMLRELRILDGEMKLVRKHIRGLTRGGPSALDPDDQLPPRMAKFVG